MGAKLKSKTHLQNTFFDFLSRLLRIWVSKNAEFHADFESVEKVGKNEPKKSYKQNKFDEHK